MKNEIICPNCNKAFKIDDTAFAEILKQVRDNEFNAELHARMEDAVKLAIAKKEAEIAALKAGNDSLIDRTRAEKEIEITKLQAKIESTGANKDAEIAKLQAELDAANAEKENAVKLAEVNTRSGLLADVAKKETEIIELKTEKDALLAKIQSEKDAEIAKLVAQLAAAETDKKLAINEITSKIEKERDELRSKLDKTATEKELAVNVAVNVIEKERDELANKIDLKDHEQKQMESSLKEKHEAELRLKDEQIAQYKDFKSKQSIKLLGENLEQHCEVTFRQWQTNGVFRSAYFAKDNDISLGGKGDYVYRETDEAGNEILSIMFDMKNEADDTIAKKRNEDYFKKLDKDRSDKKCEYAVLVSILEADSELYTGITDVSYLYDKMYVVRPQFFIPIITILRNAALNSMKYKAELALVREQNMDITNFEDELRIFQDGFMKNMKDSGNKFHEAIDGIDSTIKKLEGIKEALRLSNKHLLIAGNKIENVSIKRLTKNNPTMAGKFSELKEG